MALAMTVLQWESWTLATVRKSWFVVIRVHLMLKKGPFFDIRGQVYTTSMSHHDQIGEIIALGKSKSDKLFYKVKFADDAVEWFSEDQVFLQTEE